MRGHEEPPSIPAAGVCTSRRRADCRWRRRKHPLSRDVPNNGFWIKGARGSRIRGSHARTAARRHVWFTSSPVFLDPFSRRGYKAAGVGSIFVYSGIQAGMAEKRLLHPREGGLISLVPSWNAAVGRVKYGGRWEKFPANWNPRASPSSSPFPARSTPGKEAATFGMDLVVLWLISLTVGDKQGQYQQRTKHFRGLASL